MKKAAIILFFIAYLPMFFIEAYDIHINDVQKVELKKDITPYKKLANHLYGICTAFGVGLILLSERKKHYVPIIALFFVIGSIFILNKVMDDFYDTYYPVLLIIISTLICSTLWYYYRHKHNSE